MHLSARPTSPTVAPLLLLSVPWKRFNIPPEGYVPGMQSILSWEKTFRLSRDVKEIRSGSHQTAITAEKNEMQRELVLRSPRRSARTNAVDLGISDRSLRLMLHRNLYFHPSQNDCSAEAERTGLACSIKSI